LKKILIFMCLVILMGSYALAQEFGSIKITIKDAQGIPLPGVSATLTGNKIARMSAVSSAGGSVRFLQLPVGSDYTLRLELQGFQTYVQEKITVSFGRDVILDIALQQQALEEQVTVVGESPLIDTRRTQVGVNITSETLMSLPTARNPWVLMTLMPGMLIDREDVGGNEGGQQSSYYGHGGRDGDATWSIDGGNITDNSALGSAPAYVNIASYDEMQINYGNNDVRSQTGGVQLNLVAKRGGNAYAGTFYLDVEDKAWQSKNIPQALVNAGYTGAGIDRVYLYGANFGGPFVKDKAWFYGSWGVQDLDAVQLTGDEDKTWLVSGYARLDFQLSRTTRLNFFYEYDNKQKWGRSNWGVEEQAPETLWDQIGPGGIYKGEIDQTFGNLYLNFKGIYTDGGFELVPKLGRPTEDGSGPYLVRYHDPTHYATGNIDDYGTDRNQLNLSLSGNYFAENVLGGDHEFKFGVDYVTATVTTFDYYEGNLSLHYYGAEPAFPTGEWWEAWLVRDYIINYDFKRYAFFAQDTATFGRLTVNLGLRYDYETSNVAEYSVPASPWLPAYMPQLDVPQIKAPIAWKTFSPRVNLVYDISGDGKNLLKLSASRYGSQSGFGFADFINPVGWTEVDLIWQDLNDDTRVTANELFGLDWDTYELMDPNDPAYWLYYSFDPDNPTSLDIRDDYDPKYHSPRLDEINLSYEREIMADFAGRIELIYKRSSGNSWTIGRNSDEELDNQANYYVAGVEDITGYNIYGRTARYFTSNYRTNYPNRYDDYMAAQLVFTKRLSKKWMMDASFTLSDWKNHYKGDYIDPQNLEYYDGGVVAPSSGGSGLTGIYVNSNWQAKLTGLYQLPLGFNVSGTFLARQGYVLRTDVLVTRPGVSGSQYVFGSPDGGGQFGDERLPTFYMLALRLEKIFRLSERSYVAISADAFNATNSNVALKQQTRMTAANFREDQRILNPRVFRFGVRFNF
jgi:hypothetical protein